MRHRIGNVNTGLGNPTSCLLTNTWSKNEEFNKLVIVLLEEALNLKPIKKNGGLDFKVEKLNDKFSINFGYEPTYQYDKLVLYHIENNKNDCKIKIGVAKGMYGSNIKIIKEFNYNNCDLEFKNLINKWHSKLLKIN